MQRLSIGLSRNCQLWDRNLWFQHRWLTIWDGSCHRHSCKLPGLVLPAPLPAICYCQTTVESFNRGLKNMDRILWPLERFARKIMASRGLEGSKVAVTLLLFQIFHTSCDALSSCDWELDSEDESAWTNAKNVKIIKILLAWTNVNMSNKCIINKSRKLQAYPHCRRPLVEKFSRTFWVWALFLWCSKEFENNSTTSQGSLRWLMPTGGLIKPWIGRGGIVLSCHTVCLAIVTIAPKTDPVHMYM